MYLNINSEFNCMLSGKKKPAVELINSCDYLQINETYNLVLKKKHSYYAQVQFGMAILNLPECDFVIYSSFSNSFINIIVKFDANFVEDLFQKLQNVYFNKMLHYVCIVNNK